MFRPLTATESKKSTAAKREANKILRRGTELSRAYEAATLGEARPIEGRPVIVSIQGRRMYVDYSKLRKIATTFRRSWRYTMADIKRLGGYDQKTILFLSYRNDWSPAKGSLEMYELPEYQRELLRDLPIIEVQQRG